MFIFFLLPQVVLGASPDNSTILWKSILSLKQKSDQFYDDIDLEKMREEKTLQSELHKTSRNIFEYRTAMTMNDYFQYKYENGAPYRIYHNGKFTEDLPGRPDSQFWDYYLESGDLIIMKSVGLPSSSISRQAKDLLSYSHVAIFYRDEKTKRPYIVESNEFGLVVTPLHSDPEGTWFNKKTTARAMILSPKNRELGKMAASLAVQLAYQYDKEHHSGSRKNYKYNLPFAMSHDQSILDQVHDINDVTAANNYHTDNVFSHYQMYCVGLVRFVYNQASRSLTGNNLKIPAVWTSQKPNASLFKELGIYYNEYIPIDFLITDPAFTIKLEMVNVEEAFVSSVQDELIDQLFKWIAELHYEYKFSPLTEYMAKVIVPDWLDFVLGKINSSAVIFNKTPPGFIKFAMTFNSVVSHFFDSLMPKLLNRKVLFSRDQILFEIQKERKHQEELYINKKESFFNESFHPPAT